MNIYEMYGRQSEKLQESLEFHRSTMRLLQDLKDGTVSLKQLELDTAGWHLQEDMEPQS